VRGLSRGTPASACVLFLAILLIVPSAARAQVREGPVDALSTWWLTLGVGPSSAGAAGLLSLTTAFGPERAGSLRLVGTSSFDPMGPGTGKEMTEVSLIWHLGKSLESSWYSIGAGAGVAWGTERTLQGFTTTERKIEPGPGLAIEGQVNWRPAGRLGGSLVVFGHLGDGASFGGLVLGLQAGRLR